MAAPPRSAPRWNVPLVIAGAVLALGGFAASVFIGRASEPAVGPAATSPIVVAAKDLEQRRTLTLGDLAVAHWSSADVPAGALADRSAAVGQVLQAPLRAGQPVFSNLLGRTASSATSQASFLPLPTGYVAATLPTTELAGVAGNIRAGDYIDVLAIVPPLTAGPSNVRTIYSGVHVISVGLASDQSAVTGAPAAASLTVAVTECQAEFLAWFAVNTALKYTLLSSEDYRAAAGATPDGSCPASAGKGVSQADIKARWPGLVGP